MSGTGRRPYATPDTTTYGAPNPRLSPPVGLPEAEKRAFMALMTSTPASQFAASDLPLIVQFCELSVLAERAAEGLRNAPLLDGEGRASPLVAIHASATKGMTMLALRLKLSPQARSPKAPKRDVPQLSYYQQQALEEGDGDDENQTPS